VHLARKIKTNRPGSNPWTNDRLSSDRLSNDRLSNDRWARQGAVLS
ncbi:unnamed protein product, partial [Acidithrix sp. C25]